MSEQTNKDFVLRDSPLTELFGSNKDMRSAFNLCFSFFVLLFATIISHYLIDNEEFYSDLSYLNWCFGTKQFHILAVCWLEMQISSIFILYPILIIWLWSKKNQMLLNASNSVLTAISICFQSFLFSHPFNVVRNNQFSPVCAFALLIEQVRLSMKVHSFIEEIRYRKTQLSKDETDCDSPKLSQFLYFLIAPTFIYKDSYVRTEKIRWKFVFWNFLQVLAIMFCGFTQSWRFVEQSVKSIGLKDFEIKHLMHLLLSLSLVGMQIELLMFYGLLHCWLNGFAEMLRFGDRRFYSDWWNASDFVTYYRKWNVVVHEWLRAYVFNPCLKLTKGNRVMASIAVFLVSAVIHEYLLALSFGFFLPVLFSFFAIGGVFLFFVAKFNFKVNQNRKIGNISNNSNNSKPTDTIDYKSQNTSLSLGNMLMFLLLNLGWGLMVLLYTMEWYSRINCPTSDNSIASFFWPRLWSCATIR